MNLKFLQEAFQITEESHPATEHVMSHMTDLLNTNVKIDGSVTEKFKQFPLNMLSLQVISNEIVNYYLNKYIFDERLYSEEESHEKAIIFHKFLFELSKEFNSIYTESSVEPLSNIKTLCDKYFSENIPKDFEFKNYDLLDQEFIDSFGGKILEQDLLSLVVFLIIQEFHKTTMELNILVYTVVNDHCKNENVSIVNAQKVADELNKTIVELLTNYSKDE